MREILFRGKHKITGDWIEGSLIIYNDGDSFICCDSEEDDDILDKYEVDPETVGQYTGLTDKNGKKIFEGDIVQYYGTYPLEIFIDKGHTKARWIDTVTNREETEHFFGYDGEAYGACEIIGNIHDNPELS